MAAMHHTEAQPIVSIQSELDGPIGWVWPSYKLQVMSHQPTQHQPRKKTHRVINGWLRLTKTHNLELITGSRYAAPAWERHRAINGWLCLVPTHNLWLIAGSDHRQALGHKSSALVDRFRHQLLMAKARAAGRGQQYAFGLNH
jgi:hypothetical protein